MLDEHSAEKGAGDAGQSEDRAKISLVAAAIAGCHDIADDRLEDELIGQTEDPVRDLALHLRYFILRASSDRSCALLLRYALPITGAPSERMHAMVTAGFGRALARGGIDVPSVPAAVDLALGMLAAMLRRATLDGVDRRRIEDQTVIVLRALGVPGDRALTLAAAPLPPLPSAPPRSATRSCPGPTARSGLTRMLTVLPSKGCHDHERRF